MSPEMIRLANALLSQAAYESSSRGEAGVYVMYEAREASIKAIRAATKAGIAEYHQEMAKLEVAS